MLVENLGPCRRTLAQCVKLTNDMEATDVCRNQHLTVQIPETDALLLEALQGLVFAAEEAEVFILQQASGVITGAQLQLGS